ncbi:Methyltransferase domain-containing protein [Jatrophihabitans endophyticus]|uniref:Methyltransferase domain-containing protein n=1 Tax=Jatrophihabitans endophyticus TaxID=1206085 RepID=A0A1M5KMN7_9ACTN|nr:class I SAM-dependent methyltransferase [Jatrophihabitans endophyticus]SHG54031.1 Methyltransferase domain-containing protein [Jatrophihabitans endophyticus]
MDDNHLADLLDLDGDTLPAYWTTATTWVAEHAPDAHRVLDIGAGTGVGTLALARALPNASLLALDTDEAMLARLREKAAAAGTADRVTTLRADLDDPFPRLDPVDVTWASMSLHHMADPERVLRDLRTVTSAGGLVAVAEFADPVRFLPDDLGVGRPGLETRLAAARLESHRHQLPHLGGDYAAMLTAAGFDLAGERVFDIAERPARPDLAARYARGWLGRQREHFGDRLTPEDHQTLAVLLGDGPGSLERRDDLFLSARRTVLLARRAEPA